MAPAQRDWLRKIWRGEAGNRPSPHALLSQGTRLPFLPFAVHCARACGPGKYGLVPKADGEVLYMPEFPPTPLQKIERLEVDKVLRWGKGLPILGGNPSLEETDRRIISAENISKVFRPHAVLSSARNRSCMSRVRPETAKGAPLSVT